MFKLSKNLQTMVKDTSDLSESGKIRSTLQSKDVSKNQNLNNYNHNAKSFDTAAAISTAKPPSLANKLLELDL